MKEGVASYVFGDQKRSVRGVRIPTMPPTYSDLIAPTIPS